MILYQIENDLSLEDYKSVLVRSSLGERRPIDDIPRLTGMLRNANLIVTARKDGEILGIARCLSDYQHATYLADLAVDLAYQHQGIGKELIRKAQQSAPSSKIILLSAPAAIGYYPKIGMENVSNCFILGTENQIH